MFVYELSGENFKPFIAAGIGVSAVSGTKVGGQRISSSFN
nr:MULTISPECIES: acyloxyacyl hydrolase [unclassified Pseudomonas]